MNMPRAERAVSDSSIDFERLAQWLRVNQPEFAGIDSIQRLGGGQSNPTYILQADGRACVMRCKPAPAAQLLPSAHAIEREFRVMRALAGSAVPVPRMYCLCEDESVIGRAFFLMEYIPGRIVWDQALPGMTPMQRRAHYAEMMRVLAALHTVEPAAAGLASFGRPEGYFARQIARWSKQYMATQLTPVPAMDALIEWLPHHTPSTEETALVHGDFRIDNLVFHPDEPRVLAVLDWELATLGHPLADLSYHCLSWHLPRAEMNGLSGVDCAELGIPTQREHVQNYCRLTGRASADVLRDWSFYMSFNLFRLAGIAQGIARRALDGTASDPAAASKQALIRPLAELGWKIASGITPAL